ncbi:unnamed protein product [Allacma fusca]|uniref:peptidylprolyl isomerase n=1 Tax=Allacma fusca TaxID=39272 RepID=A0A8J2NZ37_9HEXA|nr:unnamed protein product [Allacma fusca]
MAGGDIDRTELHEELEKSEELSPSKEIKTDPQESIPTPSPPSPAPIITEEEIAEKASLVKEHDVLEDEIKEADKIQEDLKQELEENDGWIKILGNDSLLKKVVKPGVDNKRPLRGEICTIRLEGRLQSDQTVFESVESFTFQLGDTEVVPGLDMSIPLMSKNEVSLVKVSARFGYGAKGLPPVVPANADLEYEIELLDFEIEKELETLTVSERKSVGIQKRERGNWWYGRDEASLAIQCYRRALEFLDDVDGGIAFPDEDKEKTAVTEELRQLIDERLKTYNNMAAAQLKLKAYDAALTSVEAVLKCQPNNSKALYRKGKILTSKGDTDGALEAFRRVSELEPNTKSILQEINQLQAKRKKEREGEKMLYKRMFKGPTDSSKDDQEGKNASTKSSFSIGLIEIRKSLPAPYMYCCRC